MNKILYFPTHKDQYLKLMNEFAIKNRRQPEISPQRYTTEDIRKIKTQEAKQNPYWSKAP